MQQLNYNNEQYLRLMDNALAPADGLVIQNPETYAIEVFPNQDAPYFLDRN